MDGRLLTEAKTSRCYVVSFFSGQCHRHWKGGLMPPLRQMGTSRIPYASHSSRDGASVGGASRVFHRWIRQSIRFRMTKWAGPKGACSVYALILYKTGIRTLFRTNGQWAYCYKIEFWEDRNSGGGECLHNLYISDPAPVGGIRGRLPRNVVSWWDGSVLRWSDEVILSGTRRTLYSHHRGIWYRFRNKSYSYESNGV